MGPGYFVIAILGCADGGTACTPVATAPTRYESQAACEAATVETLTKNSDFDFPSLLAQCRAVGPSETAEKAKADQPTPRTPARQA